MDVISYVLSKKYTDEKCKEMDNIFQDYKNQSMLKTIGIEKELNDFKNTLQQVNVNQEAKQSTSGYGIVDLPKNAANGQVSVGLKGRSYSNLVPNSEEEKILTSASISHQVNITGNNNDKFLVVAEIYQDTGETIFLRWQDVGFASFSPSATERQWVKVAYIGTFSTSATRLWYGWYKESSGGTSKVRKQMLINLTSLDETETDINKLLQKYNYISTGTKSTISAMRITAENEDKTEKSQAYVVAKKDNKIVNLRSLPNGVADEIDLDEGILLKKINKLILEDGNIFRFTKSTNINNIYIRKPNDGVGFGNVKMNWVTIDGFSEHAIEEVLPDEESSVDKFTTANILDTIKIGAPKSIDTLEKAKEYISGRKLTYQLAEPEHIPIQVSGNIVSNPSGTIYIEQATFATGIYNDNMKVMYNDLPIKSINKIIKIDYETGVEHELDTLKAVISEDKLSFIHPDLTNGDIVFFDYEYDLESTHGETTVEFYDSRYTIKDSVTGKFYQWNVTVADGVPSIDLKEV